MGLERAHAQLLGQGEGLLVVGFGLRALWELAPRHNGAQEAQGRRLVAAFLVKVGADNADPRRYLDRLSRWEASVRKAGATDWVVVNDLENNLESILTTR